MRAEAAAAVAPPAYASHLTPLRVVALAATEAVSGPGRQLAALAGALPARDAELRVVVFRRRGRPHPPFAAYLERTGVAHRVVEDRGPLDLRMVRELGELLERWRPDVVQTHGYKATAIAWALRRRGAGWPWIGCFHGETTEDLKARLYHRLDRRMLAAADRVVVMSRRQAERFGRCEGRVRVVHNAVVPLPAPAEDDAAAAAVDALPRPRVGVVGRLSPEKGVDVLLRALALLAGRGDAPHLAVVGDGPDRGALEALAGSLGIAGRVAFVGRSEAVPRIYPKLDLLALPSRSEGLPNVLLEALAADLPVVCTDVGAVPEVLAEPEAGEVVPPEDPGALADALARALTRGRDATALLARRRAAAQFSLERRAERHLSLYRELAAARR